MRSRKAVRSTQPIYPTGRRIKGMVSTRPAQDEWLNGRYLEKRLQAWQDRRHEILRQLENNFKAPRLLSLDEAYAAVDVAFYLVDELRNYALCLEAQAGEICEKLRRWEARKAPGQRPRPARQ